jgi:diaminopimelate decarboxylase
MSVAAYAPQLPINCSPWKARAMKAAVDQGLLSESKPLAMFWNFTELGRAFDEVKSTFPSHAIHTVAAKANPLLSILKFAKGQGAGCECASLGELKQAVHAGFAPDKIVFDSPVKTREELQFALDQKVNINVDNFQELRVLDGLFGLYMRSHGVQGSKYLGIRINAEVGAGSIETHSTSVPWSKFGIGIKEYRNELLDAFKVVPGPGSSSF